MNVKRSTFDLGLREFSWISFKIEVSGYAGSQANRSLVLGASNSYVLLCCRGGLSLTCRLFNCGKTSFVFRVSVKHNFYAYSSMSEESALFCGIITLSRLST